MTTDSSLRGYDPTVPPTVEPTQLARRFDLLDGKTIGPFNNQKLNAARPLDLVGEQLRARYPVRGFVRGIYNAGRGMRREEWIGLEQCDAVVLGNGD
jgi:hypothetical protein